MMEAVRTSETSVYSSQTTQRYIPEILLSSWKTWSYLRQRLEPVNHDSTTVNPLNPSGNYIYHLL
jgi:hypothetical protein